MKKLSGVISYVITPYNALGNLDVVKMSIIINELIHDGADAIAILGCAGECSSLTNDEKKLAISLAVDCVKSRVPVVVGICESTPQESTVMAEFAQSQGADVLMISPALNYASDDELIEHYRAISESLIIPIMVYNNPAVTGTDISIELLCKLVEQIPSIVMIKESSSSVEKVDHLIKALNGKANVLCGCNFIAVEALLAGADGWCTVSPSLIGNKAKSIYKLVKNGNKIEAIQLFEKYRLLFEFMVNNGLSSVVKAGLNYFGQAVGEPRKPLGKLSDDKKTELIELLNKLEITISRPFGVI